MKIVKLHANYHECGEHGDQWGDDYDVFEVGKSVTIRNKVTEIIEYIPSNGLEKHYFDIKFEDGTMQRTFNPNHVYYEPDSI